MGDISREGNKEDIKTRKLRRYQGKKIKEISRVGNEEDIKERK